MQIRALTTAILCAGLACCAVAQDASRPAGIQFHEAHLALRRADSALQRGETTAAMKLYQQAMSDYARLSTAYPDWQPGVTRFRMDHCRGQLDALMNQLTGTRTAAPAAMRPAPPLAPPAAVPSTTPMSANASTANVLRLLDEGRTADAKAALLADLKRAPDDRRVRLLLAVVRCHEGKFGDAVYVLEQLIDERIDDVHARLVLAAAYAGIGQPSNAIRELNHVLSLDPSLAEAHYNLSQLLLASEPPVLQGALHHYRRSIEEGGQPDPATEARLGLAPRGPAPEDPKPTRGLWPFGFLRHDDTPAGE